MNQETKGKFEQIREVICIFLLILWISIPVLKEIRVTCSYVIINEYNFIKFVGLIGLFFLFQDIYIKTKTTEDKKKYDKEILPISILGIFMIWTFVSSLCASNIKNAFFGTEERKDGYITYLAYAAFFSLTLFIKSSRNRKLVINTFVGTAVLNIIIVKLYETGIGVKVFAARTVMSTCFFNSNHYGYYLMLATVTANFLFVVEKKQIIKIIYLLSYSYLLYYIMLNNTFGCYLAIAFTLLIFMGYCIFNKKKIIISMVSIIIFILMSFANQQINTIIKNNINSMIKDANNIVELEKIKNTNIKEEEKEKATEKAERGGNGRIKLWKYGIIFFLEKPIFGYGPENLGDKYLEVGINQDRPHNLIIQLATTSGIVGLVLYFIAIGIILIRGLKTLKTENYIQVVAYANVITYLVSAMFGNSMYYTSPYFFIFLGFLMHENKIQKRKLEAINEK